MNHYVMNHYVMNHYVMNHYVMNHYVMNHYVMNHYVMNHYVMNHYVMNHYVMNHYVMNHYVHNEQFETNWWNLTERSFKLYSIRTTEMFLYSGGYFKRGSTVRKLDNPFNAALNSGLRVT